MPDYNIIIFDLDGTLTDPTQEMLSSAKYALGQFHIRKVDPEKLKIFLKLPLLSCFEEHFGLTHDQANQAFVHYWYYAGSFGVGQNVAYDGVKELLQTLRQRGKMLGIATARKTQNAEQILRATKLIDFFTHIMGASEDESRRTKKMILFDVLCQFPEHDNKDVVMVGDRVVDITGARDNGIDSICVTFGQKQAEDVIGSDPTYIANSVEEMAALLLNHT